MNRFRSGNPEAGFTLVELTVVVVISTIALLAIYQTLITQERTYRYQTAAIDAQGSSRMALQLLASEMREISASAGDAPLATGGSDLLIAAADSIRFRAFRKLGVTCAVDTVGGDVDVWALGEEFVSGKDTLFVFQERNTDSDADDTWQAVVNPAVSTAGGDSTCASWSEFDAQNIRVGTGVTPFMERGALVRSFTLLTYGSYRYDGDWVLGRRNPDGSLDPLVGPILPPAEGGVRFRYFDVNNNELTPTTAGARARVSRVLITVRALSPGGIDGPYVDSLSTNVYLRGN